MAEIRRFVRMADAVGDRAAGAPHVESVYVGCQCGEPHGPTKDIVLSALEADVAERNKH